MPFLTSSYGCTLYNNPSPRKGKVLIYGMMMIIIIINTHGRLVASWWIETVNLSVSHPRLTSWST